MHGSHCAFLFGLAYGCVWLQEIHISKLARGSRTELLELLQYLYKYLLSERVDRVADALQGGCL